MDGFSRPLKLPRGAVQQSSVSWTPIPPEESALSASLGYARVSTGDQDLAGQVMRLKAAGAARTFDDVISGRTFDRPGLKALLDYARAGDALMVVRLDRLGRSLRELLDVVELLKQRGVALVSLEEKIDTSLGRGRARLPRVRLDRAVRAPADRRTYP